MLRDSIYAAQVAVLLVALSLSGAAFSQTDPVGIPTPAAQVDDIAATSRRILELEEQIAENQAAWDKLYAEYQRIMNASNGRPSSALRSKVNRLDSDARKLKADIDSKTRVLEATREHLALLKQGAGSSGSVGTGLESGTARSPGGSLSEAPEGADIGGGLDFLSLLAERIPVVDEWDPVGGLGPAWATIRCWSFTESFGSRVRDRDPSVAMVRYLADGRRVLESENDGFGRPPIPRLFPLLVERGRSNWIQEKARDHLLELWQVSVCGFAPDTIKNLGDRSDDQRPSMVLRFDDAGASMATQVFDPQGNRIGSIQTDYERVGDLRRPIRQQTQDASVYCFRVVVPTPETTTLPEPNRVLEWKYDRSGRVASLKLARLKNNRTTRFTEVVKAGRSPDVDRILTWSQEVMERSTRTMSYTYDDQGRLTSVRSIHEEHSPDPETYARILALEDKISDRRLIEAGIAVAAAKRARGPENKPGDGVQCTVASDGAWIYTRVLELRARDWDARGRWTKAVTFSIDNDGEVEHYEIEREFRDEESKAAPVHGEFQLVPRSKTPPPEAAIRNAAALSPQSPLPTPELIPARASDSIDAKRESDPDSASPSETIVLHERERNSRSPSIGPRAPVYPPAQNEEARVGSLEVPLWTKLLFATAGVAVIAVGVTLLLLRRKA